MNLRKSLFLLALFFLNLMSLSISLSAAEFKLQVDLSPAGSFTGQTQRIAGKIVRTNGGLSADKIVVDTKSITTQNELRDQHLWDKLEVKKFPAAGLIKAQAKDGKGSGILVVKGKQKKINFTYEEKSGMIEAQFKVKISDFNMGTINYLGVGVEDEVTVSVTMPISQ